jgi:hypothetical protein
LRGPVVRCDIFCRSGARLQIARLRRYAKSATIGDPLGPPP